MSQPGTAGGSSGCRPSLTARGRRLCPTAPSGSSGTSVAPAGPGDRAPGAASGEDASRSVAPGERPSAATTGPRRRWACTEAALGLPAGATDSLASTWAAVSTATSPRAAAAANTDPTRRLRLVLNAMVVVGSPGRSAGRYAGVVGQRHRPSPRKTQICLPPPAPKPAGGDQRRAGAGPLPVVSRPPAGPRWGRPSPPATRRYRGEPEGRAGRRTRWRPGGRETPAGPCRGPPPPPWTRGRPWRSGPAGRPPPGAPLPLWSLLLPGGYRRRRSTPASRRGTGPRCQGVSALPTPPRRPPGGGRPP